MKIAVVTGGFEGVRKQLLRWRLEDEVVKMRTSIENTERNLQARRTALVNLERERDATPTKEIKS